MYEHYNNKNTVDILSIMMIIVIILRTTMNHPLIETTSMINLCMGIRFFNRTQGDKKGLQTQKRAQRWQENPKEKKKRKT